MERVTDPGRIAAIQERAGRRRRADRRRSPPLRESAGSTATRSRAATGRADTPAEQTLAFVNELVADQLSVAAIHRLYTGVDLDALRDALARCFDLTPTEPPGPGHPGGDGAERLPGAGRPTGAWTAGRRSPERFDDVRALDGAWLEAALARHRSRA